jgi:hypothetical protein
LKRHQNRRRKSNNYVARATRFKDLRQKDAMCDMSETTFQAKSSQKALLTRMAAAAILPPFTLTAQTACRRFRTWRSGPQLSSCLAAKSKRTPCVLGGRHVHASLP